MGGGSINMNPVNPVGTFAEKVTEVGGMIQNPKNLKALLDIWNPAMTGIIEGVAGDRGMDWEKILGSTVPLATYAQAIMKPKKRGPQKYNDRDSFWDYVRRRDARFFPEDVDPEKIREAGEKEREKLDTRPAWEKSKEEDLESVDKIFATGKKKTGQEVSTQVKANVVRSVNAYNALDEYEDKLKDELGLSELDELQKIEATERVLLEFYPRDGPGYIMDREAVVKLPDKARGGAASKNGYRQHLRDVIQYYRSAAFKEGRDMGLDID